MINKIILTEEQKQFLRDNLSKEDKKKAARKLKKEYDTITHYIAGNRLNDKAVMLLLSIARVNCDLSKQNKQILSEI